MYHKQMEEERHRKQFKGRIILLILLKYLKCELSMKQDQKNTRNELVPVAFFMSYFLTSVIGRQQKWT